MGQGRGFAGVIVAGEEKDAAMRRRPGGIAVLEDVARAVDARPLAVPHGEDAVIFGAGEEPDLLRAPDRRRAEILVDAGLELDVALLEEALGAPERLVEAAERRAAIAGDEAGGIEAGRPVARPLHHRQAHQPLGPGQEEATPFDRIFFGAGERRRARGKTRQLRRWTEIDI